MKRSFCIALSLMILFSVQACNENRKAKNYNDKTLVDDTGLALIKDGIESGNTEIKLSQMAEKQSKNTQVIAFAKMMITDHTAVGNELKKIADRKNVSVSDALKDEHQVLMSGLAQKSGVEFDKDYMQAMVTGHESAISVFKAAAGNTDKTINKFAKNTVPKLQVHLDEANQLYKSLK